MFATVPNPDPARMKGLNRAEICDVNFQEFVRGWSGRADAKPAGGEAQGLRAAYALLKQRSAR